MICLNCGIEFEAERSTAKYCSGACRAEFSRRTQSLSARDEGLAHGECKAFEDLPLDTQRAIDKVTEWCKQKGIDDDREIRIQRSIAYQNTHGGKIVQHSLSHEQTEPYQCTADNPCKHCQQAKGRHIINHGPHKPASELSTNELNRVTLPGDVDYAGACLN